MKEQSKDVKIISPEEGISKGDKKKAVMILAAVAAIVVVASFYYFSLAFDFFPIVMWGYMIALAALVLIYILYNRGFSRKGITAEMLPDEWTEEKKEVFISDGVKRLKRSKWMLILILAFLFTFLIEALTLFVAPMFSGLFDL